MSLPGRETQQHLSLHLAIFGPLHDQLPQALAYACVFATCLQEHEAIGPRQTKDSRIDRGEPEAGFLQCDSPGRGQCDYIITSPPNFQNTKSLQVSAALTGTNHSNTSSFLCTGTFWTPNGVFAAHFCISNCLHYNKQGKWTVR